jgi:hypothetical protein
MYRFWGWLNYFLMGIQLITAVNITGTLDSDNDGGVQCIVQCAVAEYK